jgi:regulator of replication initiation timing
MKKWIFIIPVVLLVGCATDEAVREDVFMQPSNEVSGTSLLPTTKDAVRNGEIIKEYGVNSYQDPNNPNIRHDPHNFQRVEKHATWNLFDQRALNPNTGLASEVKNPAERPNPYVASLEQELSRQKGITSAMREQNEMLGQGLQTLKEQAENTKVIVSENAKLKMEIDSTNRRIEEIESHQKEEAKKSSWTKIKEVFTNPKPNEESK